jgi:hypothetical protein
MKLKINLKLKKIRLELKEFKKLKQEIRLKLRLAKLRHIKPVHKKFQKTKAQIEAEKAEKFFWRFKVVEKVDRRKVVRFKKMSKKQAAKRLTRIKLIKN